MAGKLVELLADKRVVAMVAMSAVQKVVVLVVAMAETLVEKLAVMTADKTELKMVDWKVD